MYRRTLVTLLGAAALLLLPAGAALAQATDKDCTDFATQAEAQQYFDGRGGSATNNVDRLDDDGDGTVCEALPPGQAPAGDDQGRAAEDTRSEQAAAAPGTAGSADERAGQQDALPFTGPRSPLLLAAGVALLAAGVAVLLVTRYRHQH